MTSAREIPSESALQASLREQEWIRQQGEARLRQEQARFAQVTGTGNAVQTYYPTRASDRAQLEARCQAQKNYRDATLRQVGLNRTFDLIRQLDEQVYEACKGL